MTYFSKFPRIAITLNNKPYIVQDFLRRVSLSEEFTRNSAVLEDYFVRDGETPELVSNIIYGNPLYHWVILLINEIVDVRNEWPILDSKVTDLVYQKYDFEVSVPDETEYNVDDIVESDSGGEFIVIKTETGKVFLRSQVGKTYITTSTILTNVTENTGNLTVDSVIDPEEATHHFYDPTIGYIVDENYSPSTVAVTNYEYEVSENDKKRTVKVLNPDYLSLVVRQFETLIRE